MHGACLTVPLPHSRSDTEPYAKVRDAEIRALAEADGLTVETPYGHTLHDPALLLSLCKGKMPITYKVPACSRRARKHSAGCRFGCYCAIRLCAIAIHCCMQMLRAL
jgi:hypothetical protein